MASIPNKIEKFYDSEKDEFTSIAQANWKKMAELLEFLNKSYPIGMLMFIDLSQDQIPATPDPKYWHFMDGSTIVNSNSPLDGQTPPDLRNRFIRHPKTGGPVLVYGGANTVSLGHSHGGVTGFGFDAGFATSKNGSDPEWQPAGYHQHSIASALAGPFTTVPRYRHLQIYMRVA